MTRTEAAAFMRKVWREAMKGSYAEEAYEMAIKALEEPQWIPCSSGEMPEEGKEVFVTCGQGRFAFTAEGKFVRRFGGWVSAWDNDPLEDVIAWMPEPEPWRGDAE